MNTPVKILLISYSGYAYILKLKYVFVGNSLQIEINYYQIKNTNIVKIVENSIRDNSDNEQILTSIPHELLLSLHVSQHRSLELYYSLIQTIQESQINFDINKLIKFKVDTIETYLNIIQLNIVKSFIEPFCNNYDQIKINLQLLINQSPKEVKVLEENIVNVPIPNIEEPKDISKPLPEVINQPTAESTIPKPEDFVEEILINLSCSKILNRFIVHCLEGNSNYYEEDNSNSNILVVKIPPLIKLSLTSYSVLNFKYLNELIDSIDKEEAFTKISSVCKDTIANIKSDSIEPRNKSINLQILTFLIFVYGLKTNGNRLLEINSSFEYPINLKKHYGSLVNSWVFKYLEKIKDRINITGIKFEFIEDSDRLIDMDDLNTSIQKYRYLLSIDKESFIEHVFNSNYKENRQSLTEVSDKLLFNEPKYLDIRYFIEGEHESPNYLLKYKLRECKYPNHKPISEPYLHLLHIHYQNPAIILKQIEIDPIISKYSDILLNVIYKKLSNEYKEMLKYTNSTLVILEKYIRPFIKDNSTKIELYLLYQVLIPMIYDLDQSKVEYTDYFL